MTISEDKRALTLADFWRPKTVSDPRPSPDGTRLAFVSTRHEGRPQRFLIPVA
ncbi:MAG: PD40 domain-containing protein, partial [Chloroflexi bacterium]|nr:PD40 domain-containing protein [Chloroflexota bacterium]